MRIVKNSVKSKINWCIYTHKTFDVNIIANHVLEASIADIEAVVNENFIKMDECR